MPKRRSLVRQVQDKLTEKIRYGESRHLAKQTGAEKTGIHSRNTYNSYLKLASKFVKWSRENYHCRDLADTRQYVDEYLKICIDKYSPSTQKSVASALATVFDCSTKNFIQTENRHRSNITRSRQNKAKFSEKNNKEFIEFCKATGLRRSEVVKLKPEQLIEQKEQAEVKYFLRVKGKGGRIRTLPILSMEAVERIKATPDGQRVWLNVPKKADIHRYRAEYAKSIYSQHARPLESIPKSDRYYCRKDLKGTLYDKQAMKIASEALGHSRIDIIASHYLWT